MRRQEELLYTVRKLKMELDILESGLTPYTKPIKKEILEIDLANINRELRTFNKIA
jgi:hypothetical protein